MDLQEIRDLVTRDKLSKALEKLSILVANLSDKDIKNAVVLLTSRFNRLKRDRSMGLIAASQADINRNKLADSILSVLDDLEEEFKNLRIHITAEQVEKVGNHNVRKRIKIFISYAKIDSEYVMQLRKHMKVLEVEVWCDMDIKPGEEWNPTIERNLRAAKIILYMVSADFLASDFIRSKERVWAKQQRDRLNVPIIPILTKPCFWENELEATYEGLPKDPVDGRLKALSKWEDPDEAYASIVKAIDELLP